MGALGSFKPVEARHMSAREALDSYEVRIAMARGQYRQACEESADFPEFRRTAAEAVAFSTLRAVQQDAMRDLVASEFAELLTLRETLAASFARCRC
jgi:hypothetical protein